MNKDSTEVQVEMIISELRRSGLLKTAADLAVPEHKYLFMVKESIRLGIRNSSPRRGPPAQLRF